MSDGTSGRSIRAGAILAALFGVAGAAYLAFRVGLHGIVDAVVSVGWGGFALLCLYGLTNFALLGAAWLVLAPPYSSLRAATFFWARAVRDSAGEVLPFSQFGGMVIGGRAAILGGISPRIAFASTLVDITMEMVAQIVFILGGLAILVTRLAGVRSVPMVKTTAVGIVVAIVLAVAFVVVQRRGFALLEKIARRLLPAAALHVGDVDRAVHEIHENPLRMAAGSVLHLAGWLSAAFGTWLALALIGARVDFVDAIAIESLVCAARSAAVFIPAAIGVQEAGYAVMMPLFGLPADIGIAVSLLKRGREIALGIPILLSWQLAEGRRAIAAPAARLRGGVYD